MFKKEKNIKILLGTFLFVHLLIWTLVPTLSNTNLPLDTIEALAWGSNLDWGFNKHPPVSAFFIEVFYQIFGNQDWAYYFLSQLFIVLTFYIVWIFSQEFLKNKIYSFISVLLLEGIYFYNFTTPEFNVNVCQLPFWALTVFYCWRGFKKNKVFDWLLFGLFGALGVLSKYLFIYILASIDIFFIYMIIKKKIDFKCLFSLVTFFLILLPHIFWLVENNYATITYGLHRTGGEAENILYHLVHPIVFIGKQFGILIPFFAMFLLLISKFKTKINFKDNKLLFLLTINVLPIIFVILTSMSMGIKIRTMWMTPFYLFFGVLLVYIFQSKINLNKLNKFTLLFLILFFLSPSVYLYSSLSQTNKRTDYPGKEISLLVQKRWDDNFKNNISIIIGDEWFGGNLSYHLKSRPKWFNKITDDALQTLNSSKEGLGGGGVVYIGNSKILEKVCPGIFGTINKQGICMIGIK